MLSRDSRRTFAGYLIGTLLLAFYGGAVCPLMNTISALPPVTLGSRLLVGFFLAAAVREIAVRTVMSRASLGRLWLFDFALWVIPGAVVTLWNHLQDHIIWSSGLKMIVGSIALGYYASCYASLELEQDVIRGHLRAGTNAIGSGRTLAIAKRFRDFSLYSITISSVVLFLLMAKQIGLLMHPGEYTDKFLTYPQLMGEVLFVVSILMGATILIAKRYHRYVRSMFELQDATLRKVEAGDLSTWVPVVSDDEFGEIARRTNFMIGGLRERERIKATFGKYHGKLAARLLASEPKLGGEHKTVAVLFTDLRNYTTLSERLAADQVVAVLNEYFTEVVRIIEGHDGVVDKFIGDAAMAIFGLDEGSAPCASALTAAFEIRASLDALNARLRARGLPVIDNGIGIHFGQVVAGCIGSPEKLEYTVIGDTVNVAARLEALTRHLGSPIAISGAVFEQAPADAKARLVPLGDHELKGKSERTTVYGIQAAEAAA